MIVEFPPVEMADDETGILAVGGDLEVESLKLAYGNGIFPWPVKGQPLMWFAPRERAIIEFAEFVVPERLQRYLKKRNFSYRVNADFTAVIKACATSKNRKGQRGTWITTRMVDAYIRLHEAGFAHSFETINAKGELVGGLYGVCLGRYFAGESMFYSEPHASKFALIKTVEYLKSSGLTWMDVQVISPFLRQFGAKEIPRELFMEKLQESTSG